MQDRVAARAVIWALRGCYQRIACVWADSGYTGTLLGFAAALGIAVQIVAKLDDRRRGLPGAAFDGASMAVLAAALVGAATVTPGLAGVAYGFAIGTAASSVHALEAASFPRYFGVAHVGAIRGFVHALTVAGSAVGPLLLSVLRDAAGTWAAAALIVIAIPIITAGFGLFVRPPGVDDGADVAVTPDALPSGGR